MDNRIKLGQITSAVGIKGEVKVYPYTDRKERFSEIDSLLLEQQECRIEAVRYVKEMVVLKLAAIQDRSQAEASRGKYLYLEKDQLWEIPEDTYFVKDLLGLAVVTEDGQPLGELVEVIHNSAQDLYTIKREDNRTFLLPAVGEFVKNIDLDKRQMTVKLIEGLLDI